MACDFLKRHGFEIVERNYHTTFGEIDIIAVKSGDYYFIEVKTRQGSEFANDWSVTNSKKRKMNQTVRAYCFKQNINGDSIVLASLILFVNRVRKTVSFRFCVFC